MDHRMTPMLSEEELVKKLVELIQNAYNDAINANNYVFEILDIPSATRPCIEVQYCYIKDFNRIFIEYELSEHIKNLMPWERIVAKINNYINTNFFKDTQVHPEIIKYEDFKHDIYDHVPYLSPFTIGYWDCLHGHEEFIYGQPVVLNHSMSCHPFNKDPEAKSFGAFFGKVNEIHVKYFSKGRLTNEQRDAYINEYVECRGDKVSIEALNFKYNVGEPLYKNIPTAFEEYKALYLEYMGIELPDFISNTHRFYIVQ